MSGKLYCIAVYLLEGRESLCISYTGGYLNVFKNKVKFMVYWEYIVFCQFLQISPRTIINQPAFSLSEYSLSWGIIEKSCQKHLRNNHRVIEL